jgi:hypothetical protein
VIAARIGAITALEYHVHFIHTSDGADLMVSLPSKRTPLYEPTATISRRRDLGNALTVALYFCTGGRLAILEF